jgi:hypothetical protein
MHGLVPEDSFPRLARMHRSIPSTLEGVIALRHSQSRSFHRNSRGCEQNYHV